MEGPNISARKQKILTALFAFLLMFSSGFLGGWLAGKSTDNFNASNTEATQQIVSGESQLISKIAKDVGPSVVSVETTTVGAQDIFGGLSEREGAGTGIIISAEGVIITNRHVVPAGTTQVSVTLSDGTKLDDVTVIGRTATNDSLDVAFLKINDKKGRTLRPARLGDSSGVQVGDKVVAIGNALGQFQNTVTSGIISGFGRSVNASDADGNNPETLQNLFQTDAAINQGNSGGPLVNLDGQVIGINTAVATGEVQDIGFAIPINDVQGLVKSVLEKGKLLRPYLGVRYISLNDDYAAELEAPVKRGAYILASGGQPAIVPDSPAAKAGLREKDIITKVDSTTINEGNSLTSVLGRRSVGDTVTLTVLRDGKSLSIKATLAAAPEG